MTDIINENPSLRGFLSGYVAEYQLKKQLAVYEQINHIIKPDDHDRGKKYDFLLGYGAHYFSLEIKSLQSKSVIESKEGIYVGKVQVDASDRRLVTLPNGDKLETTCLLVGEFDILAVNLFAFRQSWDFGFALNRDLPRTLYKKYSIEQRQHLLATLISVSWPLKPPFYPEPLILLEQLHKERLQ